MNKSNVTGGRSHKKKKKGAYTVPQSTQLKTADNDQIYGYVEKRLGGSRLMVKCSDGETRSAVIPGKFYKKIWMAPGDIVLCELEKSNNQLICYVTHKYNEKDIHTLKSQGKIDFEQRQEAAGATTTSTSTIIDDSEIFEDDNDNHNHNHNPNRMYDLSNMKDAIDLDDL